MKGIGNWVGGLIDASYAYIFLTLSLLKKKENQMNQSYTENVRVRSIPHVPLSCANFSIFVPMFSSPFCRPLQFCLRTQKLGNQCRK